MSTLQTIVDRNRRINYVDSSQYTNAMALEDANFRIHQIEDYITSAIWEGFFWDIMYADATVVDQSEYRIPVITTGSFDWVPKIEWISIQYVTDGDFIPAREVNRQTLLQEHDLSRYETNQSESDPIYFIADDSYFVYPAPLTAIVGAIKLYWIKSLADVELTTDYDDLFWWKIPQKYYYMIDLTEFIKKWQGKDVEWENAKDIFENKTLPSLVEKLWNRKVGISMRQSPDVSKYK